MSYARNIGELADASGLIATAKLADSAVTTVKVAANAVTYAKMQSVTAGKVLGRDTSGAGVVQELPIAVNTDGSVGLGENSGGGKLEVYAAQTAAAGNKIKIQGYQVGFEMLNAAQTQNWYMGVADADSSKLYIGRGYGVGQGIAPAVKIDASDNFQINSGYGSASTAYGCRAWVNFDGNGPTIRGSGNISSISRPATGKYIVNFSTGLPDTNYAVVGTACFNTTDVGNGSDIIQASQFATGSFYLASKVSGSGGLENVAQISAVVIR